MGDIGIILMLFGILLVIGGLTDAILKELRLLRRAIEQKEHGPL
jgi:hypothetical protein